MAEEIERRFAPDLMTGQVALVTGSGSGMGRATALEMASCGAKLVLFARRDEPLQQTAEMIRARSGEALVISGDITMGGSTSWSTTQVGSMSPPRAISPTRDLRR